MTTKRKRRDRNNKQSTTNDQPLQHGFRYRGHAKNKNKKSRELFGNQHCLDMIYHPQALQGQRHKHHYSIKEKSRNKKRDRDRDRDGERVRGGYIVGKGVFALLSSWVNAAVVLLLTWTPFNHDAPEPGRALGSPQRVVMDFEVTEVSGRPSEHCEQCTLRCL